MTSQDSQHDDLNQLIGLLVDCPSLEVLTLDNCLPAMLSESSGGQKIHLPRLSRLFLGGSSSRVTSLLKTLKLSSSTSLYLACTSENTATYNDNHILPILSEHFNHPTPVKFRSFKFHLDVYRVIGMVASTSLPMTPIPHSQSQDIQADSDAELNLSFHEIVEFKVDILRRACDALCLSNLESLSISLYSLNEFMNWSEVFQHCTEVTMVHVSGRGAISLLEALTPPKRVNTTVRGDGGERQRDDNGRGARAQVPDEDHHGPAPVQVPIFPKLTYLYLELLDFSTVVPGYGYLINVVLNAVKRRKVNKMPLCIESCKISEKHANALEKVVSSFQWDHNEFYY